MTIQQFKTELRERCESLWRDADNEELLHQEFIKLMERHAEAKELLNRINQLSAPELVWRQVDEKKWIAETPVGRYFISTLRENSYVGNYGNIGKYYSNLESAKAAAQTHWNELYNQITNL